MIQTHPLTASTLLAIRQRGGVASAAELQAALGCEPAHGVAGIDDSDPVWSSFEGGFNTASALRCAAYRGGCGANRAYHAS